MKRGEVQKNLTGRRFGRLVVLELLSKNLIRDRTGGRRYLCQCDCGIKKDVSRQCLLKGQVTSCGCYRRDMIREKYSLPPGIALRNVTYRNYIRTSKKRGYEWNLTLEQFSEITSKNCLYCNRPPSQETTGSHYNGVYVYNGIDRINNSLGYIIENAVPCCWICNKAKGSLTFDEFLLWIKQVYEFNKESQIYRKE